MYTDASSSNRYSGAGSIENDGTADYWVHGARAAKARNTAYGELAKSMKRHEKINSALQHLEAKKKLNSKGRRWKVQDAKDGRPAVYKWKRERKR